MNQKYAELYPYPRGASRAVDPEDAENDNLEVDIRRLQAMSQETFLASVFLPCHHDFDKKAAASSNRAEVVVGHHQMSHADRMAI